MMFHPIRTGALTLSLTFTLALTGCGESDAPAPPGTSVLDSAPPRPTTQPAGTATSQPTSQPTSRPASASGGADGGFQIPPPPALENITFPTPDGWTRETPDNAMRVAQYRIAKAGDEAEDTTLVVSYFGPGGAGDIRSNFVRWAGQFEVEGGGDPSAAAQVEEIEVSGEPAYVMDISGTFLDRMTPMSPVSGTKDNFRMLGAIMNSPSGPLYMKFLGPVDGVTRNRDAFMAFMNGIEIE